MQNNLPPANPTLLKKLNIVSIILSMVVLLLVGLMRTVKIDLGVDFSFLPPFIAICNTLVAIFLVIAVSKIRKKDVDGHKKFIFAAMTFSAIFLFCYVLYHFTTPETRYCGEGLMRKIYFFFLLTHIVLAAVSLPFILITFSRGYTYHIESHRRMAKWVYPVWLYVAITGPICYLMLRSCYQ